MPEDKRIREHSFLWSEKINISEVFYPKIIADFYVFSWFELLGNASLDWHLSSSRSLLFLKKFFMCFGYGELGKSKSEKKEFTSANKFMGNNYFAVFHDI